jgi:hypothetical protein
MVEFRSCRAHGYPGVSQHGRTWRTDRGGCSCDHRRHLNCARAIEAASGVTVTTEPTPFILTNSRLLVHMVSNACSASEVTFLGSRVYRDVVRAAQRSHCPEGAIRLQDSRSRCSSLGRKQSEAVGRGATATGCSSLLARSIVMVRVVVPISGLANSLDRLGGTSDSSSPMSGGLPAHR